MTQNSPGSSILRATVLNLLGSRNPCFKESLFSFDENYEFYHQKNAYLHKHQNLNTISGIPLTEFSAPEKAHSTLL